MRNLHRDRDLERSKADDPPSRTSKAETRRRPDLVTKAEHLRVGVEGTARSEELEVMGLELRRRELGRVWWGGAELRERCRRKGGRLLP